MKRVISQLRTRLAMKGFSNDEYFCRPDVARERFARALEAGRSYYLRERERAIDPALIHATWEKNIKSIEEYFTGQMDENFLSNEVIKGTMLFSDRAAHAAEVDEIELISDRKTIGKLVSKDLNRLFISSQSERGSIMNSVHHLYHLLRFEQATGRKVSAMKSVVEFGGGYGNMARVVRNAGSVEAYRIIDLLLFSCLQYVFLCTAAGEDNVAFCNNIGNREPQFSLYPLPFLESARKLKAELFLSTWALSESTRAAYSFVAGCDWFGASNILIAYNDQWKPWEDGELDSELRKSGWRVIAEPIKFLPHSHYLFATR